VQRIEGEDKEFIVSSGDQGFLDLWAIEITGDIWDISKRF
jgi:hypothetical protein